MNINTTQNSQALASNPSVFGVIGESITAEDKSRIYKVAAGLSEEDAEQAMVDLNLRYRAGTPVMPDPVYDALKKAYAAKFPDNDFFNELEVESDIDAIPGKTLKLPEIMLSTNKAYSISVIEKWANSVLKIAVQLGIDIGTVIFELTPKLDGFAGYDDGLTLYTRGNSISGTDITRAFNNGLTVLNDIGGAMRGLGKGEIVADKNYFDEVLSPFYDNSRNVISGVIKEGVIDDKLQLALNLRKIVFVPFRALTKHDLKRDELAEGIESVWDLYATDFFCETDGLVISVTDERIREAMGNTRHHHRWQIAYKKNDEMHSIAVTGILDQTSKNGFIIPVVMLEPTFVSGVTITKATGHHYGRIIENGIGIGAIVEVVRSGLVIPKIEGVVQRADTVKIPEFCPSCNSPTEMDENGKHLLCTNTETCPAQFERTLQFFFQTMGNCDGFGEKAVEKMVEHGFKSIVDIYNASASDFVACGFGEKTAQNLIDQMTRSRKEAVEDWRFLASFSIHKIGKGGCENLLQHHRLSTVFDLTVDEIVNIDGFAEKSAKSLVRSLKNIKPAFDALMKLGFNLEETPIGQVIASPIAGKTVVFTGTMVKGNREEMERHAKSLGAKVSKSVSKKTNYLVCGTGVGESKTSAAKQNNVTVISEDEYLALLSA